MAIGLDNRFNVLWLQSGGCGGCTMSLLCADTPDFFGAFEQAGIRMLWHPSLSLETGADALQILRACVAGEIPLHALCVEGSVLRGPEGTGRFHMLAGSGQSMMYWINALADVAQYTVAIGTCAAYGGMTAAGDNPTDACGLQYEGDTPGGLLGAQYRSRRGLPVINVAGCPTHGIGKWIV
jgi:Ni,Fe-hydrogenase I small subunit